MGSHMLKSLIFAGSGEWCVTADYLKWRLQGVFEQPPLLLTVFFLRLTASSFESASVTTRNFLT